MFLYSHVSNDFLVLARFNRTAATVAATTAHVANTFSRDIAGEPLCRTRPIAARGDARGSTAFRTATTMDGGANHSYVFEGTISLIMRHFFDNPHVIST